MSSGSVKMSGACELFQTLFSPTQYKRKKWSGHVRLREDNRMMERKQEEEFSWNTLK